MGNEQKNDSNEKLRFVNERVVKNKGIKIFHIFVFGVLCMLTICLFFLWKKGYIDDIFTDSDEYNNEDEILERDMTSESAEGKELTTAEECVKPDMPNTIEEMSRSVVTIKCGDIITTGLILKDDGSVYIFTYYDVVSQKEDIQVLFDSDSVCSATLVSSSENYHMAVIGVNAEDISEQVYGNIRPAVLIDDEDYDFTGERIFIGNLNTEERYIASGPLTLAYNEVSIMDGTMEIFTTDMEKESTCNGFIFNEEGYVTGIVINDNNNSEAYNYVSFISIMSVKNYMVKLMNRESVPYIGIYGNEVTDAVISSIDKDMPKGIYISATKENSPAYNMGIMNGDVVVSVNGEDVKEFDDYEKVIMKCNIGQEIPVTVMRKGKGGYKEIKYSVTVGRAE